jgi:hypothetical protein
MTWRETDPAGAAGHCAVAKQQPSPETARSFVPGQIDFGLEQRRRPRKTARVQLEKTLADAHHPRGTCDRDSLVRTRDTGEDRMQEFGDIFSFESTTHLYVWGSVAFLLLYALAIVIAVTIRRPASTGSPGIGATQAAWGKAGRHETRGSR